MKHIATLALATIIAACGNDPVTYAGYFDDDQDRSVNTSQPNEGTQIFNNYGSGNMTVNNTIQNTVNYVAPQIVSSSSVAVSYQSSASTDPCHGKKWSKNDVHFEFINDKLYVLNNTACRAAVRATYRLVIQSDQKKAEPKSLYYELSEFGTSRGTYVTSTKNSCVTVESLTIRSTSPAFNKDIQFSGTTAIRVCN